MTTVLSPFHFTRLISRYGNPIHTILLYPSILSISHLPLYSKLKPRQWMNAISTSSLTRYFASHQVPHLNPLTPHELLLHILLPLPTPQLLPLTILSHRIHALILRILHNRLVAASELSSHSLLLECFHPSAKLTEPPYFCTYQGTHGLASPQSSPENEGDTGIVGKLGEMHSMYSRFRPHRRELETGGRRVRGPPGDVPGSRTWAGAAGDRFEGEAVRQILSLDGHERFTQLVAQSNLVRIGPRHGLFTAFVEVEEGVVRVFRDWLQKMAMGGDMTASGAVKGNVEEVGKGKESVREDPVLSADIGNDKEILWVNSRSKNSGLRLRVRERKIRKDTPVLIEANEDIPVSYEVEYQGRRTFTLLQVSMLNVVLEFLVRTSHLLLMLEKSLVQEDNSTGKAVVFGSFG
jgi:hypothetical protein